MLYRRIYSWSLKPECEGNVQFTVTPSMERKITIQGACTFYGEKKIRSAVPQSCCIEVKYNTIDLRSLINYSIASPTWGGLLWRSVSA